MMKWLGRALILMVAVLVVSGITYGVVQFGEDAAGQSALEGRTDFRPAARIEGEGNGQLPEQGEFTGGGRGGREGFNVYAIDELLHPLIIIAAIVVVVAPMTALLKKRFD